MRKILLGVAGAAALTMGSMASAAVNVTATTFENFDIATGATSTTIGFDDAGLDNPFTETLTFTNTAIGSYNISGDTSSSAITFTNIMLEGGGMTFGLCGGGTTEDCFDLASIGGSSFFGLVNNINLAADTAYTLTVEGMNAGTGVVAGTITISAIPEPAVWGMMIIGFAGIGTAMRRRKAKPAVQFA